MRRRGSRPGPYEEGKRSTINLGVEDMPAASNPEALSKFYTDDEVETSTARRPSSSSDQESFSPFLIREYLRVEDAEKRRQIAKYGEEKENKLRERRRSLIVSQESSPPRNRASRGPFQAVDNLLPMKDMSAVTEDSVFLCESERGNEMDVQSHAKQETSMLAPTADSPDGTELPQRPPVAPPRKKRDARRRNGVFQMNSSGSSTPGTPTTPGTPDTPLTPGTPGIHVDLDIAGFLTSHGAASGTHSSDNLTSPGRLSADVFFGKEELHEDKSSCQDSQDTPATPDTLRTLNSTPETPGSPSSPDSPYRFFPKSLLMEDDIKLDMAQKSHTMDNRRHRRRSKTDTWDGHLGQSTEDLTKPRTPQELRRSVSEYHTSGNNKARRTVSDTSSEKGKSKQSIRNKFFGQSKKDNSQKALSSRAFNKWSRKGGSRKRKESNEDQTDAEGEGNNYTSTAAAAAASDPTAAAPFTAAAT